MDFTQMQIQAAGLYEIENYTAAARKYEEILCLIRETDYEIDDVREHVLNYMLCICLLESHHLDDLLRALNELCILERPFSNRFPAIIYALTKAYVKLHRFPLAQAVIDKGFILLSTDIKFQEFYVPETDILIFESTREGLTDALVKLQDCLDCLPVAICDLDNCQNFLPPGYDANKNIFLSDPAFKGMVTVTCSNTNCPCVFKFHLDCWTYQKNTTYKVSHDQDIIGSCCLSPNCATKDVSNTIIKIEIIGANGETENVITAPKANVSLRNSASKGAIKKYSNTSPPMTKLRRPHKDSDLSLDRRNETSKFIEEEAELVSEMLQSTHKMSSEQKNSSKGATVFCEPDYVLKGQKQLISFMLEILYHYIKTYGSVSIEDVQKKWDETKNMIPNYDDIMRDNINMQDILLRSSCIQIIHGCICVAKTKPDIKNLHIEKSAHEPRKSTTGDLKALFEDGGKNIAESFRNDIKLQDPTRHFANIPDTVKDIAEQENFTLPNISDLYIQPKSSEERMQASRNTNPFIIDDNMKDMDNSAKYIQHYSACDNSNEEMTKLNALDASRKQNEGSTGILSRLLNTSFTPTNPMQHNFDKEVINRFIMYKDKKLTDITDSEQYLLSILDIQMLTMDNLKKKNSELTERLQKVLHRQHHSVQDILTNNETLQIFLSQMKLDLVEILHDVKCRTYIDQREKEAIINEYKETQDAMICVIKRYQTQLSELKDELKISKEKYFTLKRKMLQNHLEDQYYLNNVLITGKIEQCQTAVETINSVNSVFKTTFGYSVLQDNVQWLLRLNSLYQTATNHKKEYLIKKIALESDDEIQRLDDIKLLLNLNSSFPERPLSNAVYDAFLKYYEHITKMWHQYLFSVNVPIVYQNLHQHTSLELPSYTNQSVNRQSNSDKCTSSDSVFKPQLTNLGSLDVQNVISDKSSNLGDVSNTDIIRDCTNTSNNTQFTDISKKNNIVSIQEYVNETCKSHMENKLETSIASKDNSNIEDNVFNDDNSKTLDYLNESSSNIPKNDTEISKNCIKSPILKQMLTNAEVTPSLANDNRKHVNKVSSQDDTLIPCLKNDNINKIFECGIDKVMHLAREKYIGIMELDLWHSLQDVRKLHGNSLSGMSIKTIVEKMEEHILKRHLKYLCVPNASYDVKLVRNRGNLQVKNKAKSTTLKSSVLDHEKSLKNKEPRFQNLKKLNTLTNNQKKHPNMNATKVVVNSTKLSKSDPPLKSAWNPLPQLVGWRKQQEETECIVCMEDLKSEYKMVYTLICQHTFHKSCIKEWFQQNQSCPTCRIHCKMDDDFPPLPS